MVAILVRSDKETEVKIPKEFTRWATVCDQCSTNYVTAYGAEESRLETRPTGTFNTRDQLMHDATIAVAKEHPRHGTELFLWGPEKEWQSIEIVGH
jgi:hypothetical protein